MHGANISLLKTKKLSKISNAFISNINYLLSYLSHEDKEKLEKIKNLNDVVEYSLNDGVDYNKEGNIENNINIDKVKDILSFYKNFLQIDFFNTLITNYSEEAPTEDCTFFNESKKHASKN